MSMISATTSTNCSKGSALCYKQKLFFTKVCSYTRPSLSDIGATIYSEKKEKKTTTAIGHTTSYSVYSHQIAGLRNYSNNAQQQRLIYMKIGTRKKNKTHVSCHGNMQMSH